MPIKKWLVEDPVSLHRTIVEYNIWIEKEDFKILTNKLRLQHFNYYRDYMRLKLLIEFIVQRAFAWLENFRRMTIDYEFHADTAEAMVQLAFCKIMLNKIIV